MSGSRRRRLLPPLLVAFVTMTGCAAVPSPGSDDAVSTATLPVDARPTVDAGATPAPEPVAPALATTDFDPDAGYERWIPVALDRLATRTSGEPVRSRDAVCEHVTVEECGALPSELPERVVRLLDWTRDTNDGWLAAPHQILYVTAVACLLLDEMEWNDAVVLLGDHAEVATDLSALGYSLVALATPQAVAFLCPEHEAVTRDQMTAVVCADLGARECDQFEASWPSG